MEQLTALEASFLEAEDADRHLSLAIGAPAIVEGLPDDRWATLMKIHHCIADGIAAVRMLASVCDTDAGETFASDIRAAKEPRSSIVRQAGLGLNPLTWVGGTWRASMAASSAVARTAIGTAEFVGGLLTPAAGSSLRGSVAKPRRSSPDVDELAGGIELGITRLAASARKRKNPTERRRPSRPASQVMGLG